MQGTRGGVNVLKYCLGRKEERTTVEDCLHRIGFKSVELEIVKKLMRRKY